MGGESAQHDGLRAGVISVLNNFPPLGFLNPLLYNTGVAGLSEIMSGTNLGQHAEHFGGQGVRPGYGAWDT
ncbi:hypothetical protein BC834DRAFT_966333 [Gloeopeniophorella convolvens]|nr:hypothetical protein BC834DRAFT_966333 [Gloeopeniophorella convolvens]